MHFVLRVAGVTSSGKAPVLECSSTRIVFFSSFLLFFFSSFFLLHVSQSGEGALFFALFAPFPSSGIPDSVLVPEMSWFL